MPIKIPLPDITTEPVAKAHPFPLQVAYQTQEFIQAILFHTMFSDVAAGEYVRLPNSLSGIRTTLVDQGMSAQLWEDGWKYLQKYQEYFSQAILRSVLISTRSHWDWYVKKLGEFISQNRQFVFDIPLSKTESAKLRKIGFKEITQQIKILEKSCDVSIPIQASTSELLHEMSLVRNLGLHNRWEIDAFYLSKTKTSEWLLNEVRNFDVAELQSWHAALINTISKTATPIAIKFKDSQIKEPIYD
ncbi:hypothetical protein ACFLV4_04380 [Chloroflexota bacterium]